MDYIEKCNDLQILLYKLLKKNMLITLLHFLGTETLKLIFMHILN